MKFKFLLVAGAASAAIPATAAVTVIGNSYARSCYEAAESKSLPRPSDLENCDRAIADEALTEHDRVATHVNRGVLRSRRGHTEAALTDFDAALARDPSEPEAYFNKAAVLLRSPGGADEALKLFSVALEKKTRHPARAYLGRGIAQEELGNLRAAYSDYRRASAADPKWAEPRTELARFVVKR